MTAIISRIIKMSYTGRLMKTTIYPQLKRPYPLILFIALTGSSLPASAEITLSDGSITKLSNIINGGPKEVLSYNPKTGKTYPSRTVSIKSRGKKKIYKIKVAYGANLSYILRCSGNHKIWVNNSWVKAEDLKKGDIVSCLPIIQIP